ncbi:hypothetical protein HNP84_001251 [Thermocatellispora tengchongensis]|uniref:Uncharacterized protein n=1 Tax=Thermocatellispora tengchongensis TaxID=1073253 RepID=A0A840P6B3_9ACTN|nr:hypothetical protein [Thermocatellispora tengchongensis]MBB5131545.1 hypothetical protein [Thermocatellispora tengchongensis]
MFDEIIAHYTQLVNDLDCFAFTVTIPDSGVLTVQDAARRLGGDPATLSPPGRPHPGDPGLSLYEVGAGVLIWEPSPAGFHDARIDRLAGEGFRYWSLACDIEGNTSVYVRYGNAEGHLDDPHPDGLPFTLGRDDLGPIGRYADLLACGYDSEEAEATVEITAACLAVIELESGVRVDFELLDGPYWRLPSFM